jgi:hypothetical protein
MSDKIGRNCCDRAANNDTEHTSCRWKEHGIEIPWHIDTESPDKTFASEKKFAKRDKHRSHAAMIFARVDLVSVHRRLHQCWTLNHFVIAAWSAKAHNPPTMRTSIKIPIRLFLIALMLALAWIIGLVPKAQAVSPAPDGGYPGGNTAEGQKALSSLTTGGFNAAIGYFSLFANTTGSFNTAVGAGALDLNTGGNNTAVGAAALLLNTTGANNTAAGTVALSSNTTGNANTAYGNAALGNNTTGNVNIGLGEGAGTNVIMANNVICIGAAGADASNTTWISNVYAATTLSGTTLPVVVSDGGQLGTASSSQRFKKEIKPMDTASDAILSLRPVTFHYKTDTKGTPQFGLIAEEVAKVNPALVIPDKEGKPYTVRYEAVNAMLLNEFLKEHRAVQQLKSTVAKQETTAARQEAIIAKQQKQIETLTAGLQKVSAELEVSQAAPRTVLNSQ